ncbi:MAG: SDR family NAD(P)-dependent oxidoreductase, partial [Planctomycetes bacterium]|nr:SDR family NAD(P)-dependent oxidoreductase [Planctomycetota bacterium]
GFVADMAEPDGVDALVARLNEESIIASVLVNNAGVTVHGPFAETELALELRLVRLQIDAMLTLTKSVLPAMIARGSGRVMNVGSIYGFAGAPYQATYAATKAFLLGFTRSLRVELEGSGVSVTLVSPGLTRSRFRSRSGLPDRESSFMMDPDVVARKACEAIFAGRRGNVPGLRNRLFLLATKVFPERWFMGILSRVNARRRLGAKS